MLCILGFWHNLLQLKMYHNRKQKTKCKYKHKLNYMKNPATVESRI